MIPHRTPFFLPLLYPSLLWRMNPVSNELFLTFDDGPVPGPTEFVLESLNKFSVKATFFCIGDNVRKNERLFSRIVSEGHAIGNHTFHHINGWKSRQDQYVNDIRLCDDEFKKTNDADLKSKLFRPPYGRITRDQIKALGDYRIVMWDVLSVDYNQSLSKESCFRNTLKAVRSGSIIVFHDSVKAERNLTYALPRFLESCLSKGYTFSVIDA